LRRRDVVAFLCGALAVGPRLAYAESRLPRVGVLWHGADEKDEAIYFGAVRQGLSDFGYVDGKNIVVEHRFAAEVPERFASFAAELVGLEVDVLVANNRLAALAAQRATTTLAQHLPAAVYSRETVAAGALASYGPDNYGIFRRTGYYVDRILKGDVLE
jgi:putative tryptophan/tyrosine transport system substrate-binding protein